MVIRFLKTATVLLLLQVIACSSAYSDYKPDEVLVKYKSGRNAGLQAITARINARVIQEINPIRFQRIKLPAGMTVDRAIAEFRKNPDVEYVGPNHIIHACRVPNDDIYVNGVLDVFTEWWLDDVDYPGAGIDAPQAWDIETGSPDVIIAIVDTGVMSTHEDLHDKIIRGRNVLSGADPDDTEDDYGHGTEVAGVAAAMTNNSIGMAGVCWGAKIMPIKILDSSGAGQDSDAALGIIWAADHGADIINMSFGGYDFDQSLKDAVEYAWNKGCVLIGGSGNDDSSATFYPACYEQVVCVGASNEEKQRCTAADWGTGGSNYGPSLDLMAPGTNIVSTTLPDLGLWDPYAVMLSGTSFAAPVVSGVAALLKSHFPNWTSSQIVQQMKETAKDIGDPGWDQYTGYGLVSAYRALSMAPQTSETIGDLANMASGQSVMVTNAVITSGSSDLPDRFYIEQLNRACAIKLPFVSKPLGYNEGDRVDVMGILGTDTSDGERMISGATISRTKVPITPPTPGEKLLPLGMSTRTIGGTRLGYKSGITNGRGLNNVGLLVSVWGKVTAVGWTYFYVDDGSGMHDGSGMRGMKVLTRRFSRPAEGDMVKITGIVGVEKPTDAGVSIPVIRVRRQEDIQIIKSL